MHEQGFDALRAAAETAAVAAGAVSPAVTAVTQMPVDALTPARYQPRQVLTEDGLHELADSIREQGVLQPLIARALQVQSASSAAAPRYEIVAGERRWRAAQLAGLATVPVVIRELDDQSALAVALIENVQREDLNPIDQARSVAQLASEFSLTHERVGQALGRSRVWVTNMLRLLDLDDQVKDLLAQGKIDMGHARAVLSLDREQQVKVARTAQRWGWSVRQVEKAVKTALNGAAPRDSAAAAVDLQTRWLQRQIERELGTRLAIRPGKSGGYSLQVDFESLGDLQDVLQRLQELIGRIRETAGPRAREAQRGTSEP